MNFTDLIPFWLLACVYLTTFFVAEVLYRAIFMFNEHRKVEIHQNTNGFREILRFNTSSYLIMAGLLLSIILILNHNIEYSGLDRYAIIIVISVQVVLKICNTSDGFVSDIKYLRKRNGLNCPSSMSTNYFYGYLKFMLPDYGDTNVGILENMQKYEDKHGIKFAVKRIFLLIPTSMFISQSLVNLAPDGEIEAAQPLESITRNVAGVIGRIYKNPVYKIKIKTRHGQPPSKPIYCVAEGATPLHTLRQSIEAQGPSSRKYQMEIVKQFYESLLTILKHHKDCGNTYDLLYYDDSKPCSLAQILINRINNLSK